MRAWLVALLLAHAVAGAAEELHGKTDVFSAPGVALAWAVERGADEATTFVVIRVIADRAKFASMSVTGRDPFTKEEKAWVRREAIPDVMEVRLQRSGFADFPRTELRFFDSTGVKPKLEVYYLGVPDTTPEFAERSKLDAYLAARIRTLDPGTAPR